jgi:hypothetical protein
MKKIFYNKNDILVSDTVFIATNGDQYPIRNISSVSVRSIYYIKFLIVAIFFVCTPKIYYDSHFPETALLGGIPLIVWFSLLKYQLMIGSGGILQVCIELPMWKLGSLQLLRDIKSAINESINNLQ